MTDTDPNEDDRIETHARRALDMIAGSFAGLAVAGMALSIGHYQELQRVEEIPFLAREIAPAMEAHILMVVAFTLVAVLLSVGAARISPDDRRVEQLIAWGDNDRR